MSPIKFTHMGSLILIPNTINKFYVGLYFSFTTIKPCLLNNLKLYLEFKFKIHDIYLFKYVLVYFIELSEFIFYNYIHTLDFKT